MFMMRCLRRHPEAAAVVALFVILGTVYSLVTPVFETPDETFHYPVIDYIARTGRLAEQHGSEETLWMQEGTQPPLYYLLGAGLTVWVNTSDLPEVRRLNPHAWIGRPDATHNQNRALHGGIDAFPWQGTILAIHLIRFMGVLFGAGSAALAYLLALTIWPENRAAAVLTAALTAFNPQFLFISGAVNNDTLMFLLGTWLLLLIARIWQEGITTRRAITLAMVTAAATLTKTSGLTFVPVIGLAVLARGWREKRWRPVLFTFLGMLAAWAALAGWWYLRNWQLYGDPLAIRAHLAAFGTREITLVELAGEWYGLWASYWAVFGWFNVLADRWVYILYGTVSAAAILGTIWWVAEVIRRRQPASLALPAVLGLQILITFAGLVQWSLQTSGSQGRLMFPVIGAISALTANGLLHALPEHWQRPASLGGSAVLLTVAFLIPWLTIRPVYTLPPMVETLPDDAIPVGASFEGLEIAAVSLQQAAIDAGEPVRVTVYVRAQEVLQQRYSLSLTLLGRGYAEVGKIDTYPGRGMLPTTEMAPGVLYADSYLIPTDSDSEAPSTLRLMVGAGLVEEDRYMPLAGQLADGSPTGGVVIEGAGVLYPENQAACTLEVAEEPAATLGDFARVWGEVEPRTAHPGDIVAVTLYWDVLKNPGSDLTVFVHLPGGEGQPPAAQADGQPLNGDYPTSEWLRPCPFADTHMLHLPEELEAGTYTVMVGLYNAQDPAFTRIPATSSGGDLYPNNAVPIGTLHVEK
jgi:4-amino-4-deoxy-L-arabinose transferase-like glycosyltransferase